MTRPQLVQPGAPEDLGSSGPDGELIEREPLVGDRVGARRDELPDLGQAGEETAVRVPLEECIVTPHFVTCWNGTREESQDLVSAIARNCVCEYGLRGIRIRTCAAHQMLADDQRALDGLVFVRRLAERLRLEEHIA